jgi:hypothetical protein
LRLRIVKEADVECAEYHHLRRYTGEDPRWRVLARKHVRRTGYYVDLLIFKNYRPAIALELKWGKRQIGTKDRQSLAAALEKLGVHKAYWLSAVSSEKPSESLLKESIEKGVLHCIIVRLGFSGPKLAAWKQRRKRFRERMGVGKGHKLIASSNPRTS